MAAESNAAALTGRGMEALHREQPALLARLVGAVRGYLQGTETAREVDEQLAFMVEHMAMCFEDEETGLRATVPNLRGWLRGQQRYALWRARQAMVHWLQHRDSTQLLRYLRDDLWTWRVKVRKALGMPGGRLPERPSRRSA